MMKPVRRPKPKMTEAEYQAMKAARRAELSSGRAALELRIAELEARLDGLERNQNERGLIEADGPVGDLS